MRILHISTASSWRGGERQTFYLIDGQLMEENIVHLMTPFDSMLSKKCSDLNLGSLNFRKGAIGLITNIRKLVRYVKDHNIELVHGHDSHAHSLIWLAYKFGNLDTKSIITRRLANSINKRSIGKYNYHKIEAIICVSDAVKRTLSRNIVNNDRLTVIHSGVELPTIVKRKKYHSKPHFTIGYVAAFSKEKDHTTFIAAAKLLLRDDINLRFLLIGDGVLLEEMKSLVAEDEANFEFTGFMDNVAPFYEEMDLLMHTSQAEALGTSIIDALKFSIPVVASDVGGVNEIIIDKKNGLLAKANNPHSFYSLISKILRDKVLYNSMSSYAYNSILKFDKSIMIEKTQRLYSKILPPTLQDY